MDLSDDTTVPAAALPVAQLRDQLRLGSGFADDTTQDAALERYLRAAIAMIEGRTGKVLLHRTLSLRLRAWRDPRGQPLPVAPVAEVQAVELIDAAGAATPVDPARWRLHPDLHRPRLLPAGAALPAIAPGGAVRVVFQAGFGPAWDDLPADLAQAVLMLAAQLYEHRTMPDAVLPASITSLLARWREVRVGGGA